jgi:hypothetical protein
MSVVRCASDIARWLQHFRDVPEPEVVSRFTHSGRMDLGGSASTLTRLKTDDTVGSGERAFKCYSGMLLDF